MGKHMKALAAAIIAFAVTAAVVWGVVARFLENPVLLHMVLGTVMPVVAYITVLKKSSASSAPNNTPSKTS